MKKFIKEIIIYIGLFCSIVCILSLVNHFFNKSYDENLKLRFRYTKYNNEVVSIQNFMKKTLSKDCGEGYTTGWGILEKSTKTYYFEDVRMILDARMPAPKFEDRASDAIQEKDFTELYMPNIAKYNPYYSKATVHEANNLLLKFTKYAEKKETAEAFYCNEINNCASGKTEKENIAINFAFGKYKNNKILEGIVDKSNHPTTSIAMLFVLDNNVDDVVHGFWIAKMQHYKYITNKCDGEVAKNILEKMARSLH
jgi:hypothetical protein